MTEPEAANFDPVLLEVLWSRLISTTEEMAQTLMRTGLSTILTDAGDLCACLFDSQARMVAQATTGTPGHINALATGLHHFLRRHPPQTLRPGDVLIGNNPYDLSGHLYDFTIITPVFYRDRLVGYFGSTCHVVDVGGRGMTTECESIFEEGLHVPYLKLHDAGKPNRDLFEIIAANSREPYKVLGDLRAQVVANSVSARRLCSTLEEFRLADIDALSDRITRLSERAMREAISELPDGEFEHVVTSDGFDVPIRLHCRLAVRGEEMAVDFAGSSPASDRAVNVCLNFTKAYTYFAVKSVLAPDVPNNSGSFLPIAVSAPAGCVLNAVHPLPTVARHTVSHFVAECVVGALYQVVPDRVIAEGSGATWDIVAMGRTADEGVFSSIMFTHGGMGARAHRDGLSATPFPSGIRGTPIEVMESSAPIVIHQYELRPDSGGPGKHRGGLGQTVRFGVRTGRPWRLPTLLDRTVIPPRGLSGGHEGARGEVLLNGGEPLAPKGAYTLQPDDIVTFKLPGGGGYGPAAERDPASVMRDVEEGYVSAESAQRQYAVRVEQPPAPGGAGCGRRHPEGDED